MNAFAVGSITFACTFIGAWLGTLHQAPTSDQDKEVQDAVRLGMGLVATMTAILLGLIIAAAKGSFDSQDAAIRSSSANVLALDRVLARYGPETRSIRELLRQTVADRLEIIWPTDKAPRKSGFQPGAGGEAIEDQILALHPDTEAERWFKSQALILTQDILRTRWRILTSESSIPSAFLIVLVSWLTAIFASFGLFAPRSATLMVVFFVAALCVSAAVFLILELDSPFQGIIKVSSGPVRYALENLGK